MDHPMIDRRTLIRSAGVVGAGAGALAGCGSADTGGTDSPAAPTAAGAGGAPAAGTTVPVAAIPVGGGTIVEGVVVTQPTKGDFKAFSSVCTHQGCPVSKIEGTSIECMCHGSMFDIATGAPTAGPARRPLAPKTATLQGSDVVVT